MRLLEFRTSLCLAAFLCLRYDSPIAQVVEAFRERVPGMGRSIVREDSCQLFDRKQTLCPVQPSPAQPLRSTHGNEQITFPPQDEA